MKMSCYDHLRVAMTVLGIPIKQLDGLSESELATVAKHLKLAAAKSDELGVGHPFRGLKQSWPAIPKGPRGKKPRRRGSRLAPDKSKTYDPSTLRGRAEGMRQTPEMAAIKRYEASLES